MRTSVCDYLVWMTDTTKGWAIVTGASGGIGTVFTRSLVERGYPVLAVARKAEPLRDLAAELTKAGGRVEVAAVDLGTEEGVEAVVKRTLELGDVELLVNNAGVSTSGHFLDQSYERELSSIRLNIEALYTLTRKLVPGMVERKRGGVINVASIVGFQAIPYWTTYAATKAFVLAFGEGLAYELRKTGVRVLTVCPGFTKTGLYAETGIPGLAGRLLPHATPEKVVATALKAYDRKRVVRIVGFMNRMMAMFGAPTPRPILRWMMAKLFAPANKALPSG